MSAIPTDRATLLRWGTGNAHQIVARAIRHGELKPATEFDCVDCGDPAGVYDHRDYSKPLDVVPVCVTCNRRRGPGKRLDFDPADYPNYVPELRAT
jgi:hypothetical protein